MIEAKLADSAEHLRLSLEHISKGRAKQIVIFIDNVDQRGDETQDAAFLIAQEIANKWPALVYIPLRPETFHRSKRAGALTGYHEKAFTIEPPRVDDVILKRLTFALNLIEGRIATPFMTDDMSLKIPQLRSLIKAMMDSLTQNDELAESIDNIAGSNVRMALGFVRDFFGSGHVDTQKIINAYNSASGYVIPVHEFLRAVIYSDAQHYSSASSSPTANMFDICCNDTREHFLMPLLLATLRSAQRHTKNKHGFVSTEELYESLQSVGFVSEQVDFAVVRAYRKRLIETPARGSVEENKALPRAFRITTGGTYHVSRLISMFTYVDAMIVDTPIVDDAFRKRIVDESEIFQRLDRCELFCSYLDSRWAAAKIVVSEFDWAHASEALRRDIAYVRESARRWQVRQRRSW